MKLSSIAMLLVLVSTLFVLNSIGNFKPSYGTICPMPQKTGWSRLNTTKTQYPMAIVAAMHESHVQATVICTKNRNYHLRIRSGGHDYEGLSYISNEPFVPLDMSNLRSINVQAEASLGELYLNISQKSKTHAFPGGICPFVGVGGHFIVAGYGNLMRKYGLSVDNIIDAQQVNNVNGKILNRESMGEDHFWAIRGGGASFGVILSWKIKLVSVLEVVTFFMVKKLINKDDTSSISLKGEIGLHDNTNFKGNFGRIGEEDDQNGSGYKFLIQYWSYNQDDSAVESLRKLYDFMAPYVMQSPREAFLNCRDLVLALIKMVRIQAFLG
ncbi:hypothetical protein ACSBR2_014607 [Camellia fascicularis]